MPSIIDSQLTVAVDVYTKRNLQTSFCFLAILAVKTQPKIAPKKSDFFRKKLIAPHANRFDMGRGRANS